MRVNVGLLIHEQTKRGTIANCNYQDPEVQKKTGKTSPVDVMGALREMKNAM